MAPKEQPTTGEDPAAIGIDWGTTRARAYLLDHAGGVLAERADGRGTLALASDPTAFASEADRLVGEWARNHPVPIVACGMVGSDQGWVEAPYRALPAPIDVAGHDAALARASFGSVHILPGIRRPEGQGRWPDVMRGEETQLLGALESGATARVVLPGTHTKWVDVVDGRVVDLVTTMPGEIRALLLGHGIVGRLAASDDEDAPAAFARGLDVASEAADRGSGILETAFSARTLAMAGDLARHEVRDYLSGLVIGADVAAQAPRHDGPLVLCGAPALTGRYATALDRLGIAVTTAEGSATALGLWRATIALGLVKERA